MRVNESLAKFSSAINGLLFGGGVALTLGLFVFLSGGSSPLGLVFGVLFLYIGSGLIALGIFGAFLRITAKAVIEGLGGNFHVDFVSKPVNSLNDEVYNSLSTEQKQDWESAGRPNLKAWDEAGRPDFKHYK
jgi:hypothetical protein